MPVVLRRARELLVAGTTLSIAAAAHLLAGGSLPRSALAWVVVLALTLPVAVWTGRRRLTLVRVLPAMVVLQVVQHGTLEILGTAAARTGAAEGPRASDAVHAAHLDLTAGSLGGAADALATAPGTAHHASDAAAGALMLTAHAVAVVLTALLLVAGDRAAAGVVAGLGAVALLVQGAPAFAASRVLGPVRGRTFARHDRTDRSAAPLRGPPAGACAPA
ncbi:hypothetical protein LEP48_15635 [Isoptericola sp. NEAU-Y5]|uniref:ABC transporter ATP-binding protein n=1 Tax=Isoptericola luteus TaxID=2879484 RepID=A0ABS7ZK66_9MICO|nr:hypothetical protein [Isoptericola sp. NEAU-Y5]MCA5894771.1 hypothetical protein [Isoptericola sp. NEAU-Y5]